MKFLAFLTMTAGMCFGQGFGIEPPPFPTSDARPSTPDFTLPNPPAIGTLPYAYPVPRSGAPRTPFPAVQGQHAFLIGFKDRTVDSALKYWVTGRTLHYINLRNETRAVATKRIDWKLMKKMNPESR